MIPLLVASHAVRMNSRKREKTAASTRNEKPISHYFKPFSIDNELKSDAFGLGDSLIDDLNELTSSVPSATRTSRSHSTPRPPRRPDVEDALQEPGLSLRRLQASPARARPITSRPPAITLCPPVALTSPDSQHAASTKTRMPAHPSKQRVGTNKLTRSDVQKQILLEKAAQMLPEGAIRAAVQDSIASWEQGAGRPSTSEPSTANPSSSSKPRPPRTQRTAPRLRRNSLSCLSAAAGLAAASASALEVSSAQTQAQAQDQDDKADKDVKTDCVSSRTDQSVAKQSEALITSKKIITMEPLVTSKESLLSQLRLSNAREVAQLPAVADTGSCLMQPIYPKSTRFDLQWVLVQGRWVRKQVNA